MSFSLILAMLASAPGGEVPSSVIDYYYCAAAQADLIELDNVPGALEPEQIATEPEMKCTRFYGRALDGFFTMSIKQSDVQVFTKGMTEEEKRKLAKTAFEQTSTDRLVKHITEFQLSRAH